MSSLIFDTSAEQAIVATDTLAVSTDGKPLYFTSKALVLPHLKMIIAGTGVAGFLDQWFIALNGRHSFADIDDLNTGTPRALCFLWGRYIKEIGVPEVCTTTVYHFGFSEKSRIIHAYSYHSAFGFRSEVLTEGLKAKPVFTPPKEFRFPEDAKLLMETQRATEATKPKEQRLYIGGEIQIHALTNEGISIYSGGSFDDYSVDAEAIRANKKLATEPCQAPESVENTTSHHDSAT